MPEFNPAVADAVLDTFGDIFPAGSSLELRDGAPSGLESVGNVLVRFTVPDNGWSPSQGGVKDLMGLWQAVALAGGTAGHYRFTSPDGRYIEVGTVSGKGGGGDLQIDNVNVARGQAVTLNRFLKTLG